MPNIKSAIKRVKVSQNKTLQNQMIKSNLKTTIKKFEACVQNKDTAVVQDAFRLAVKKIDQAVAKGTMHKNTASRKKSQLNLKLNHLSA